MADLVAELADHGLAHEERGDRLGTPGRPSPMVHATTEGALVLAIGIAVHWLTVAIVGLGGVVHRQASGVTARMARPTLDQTFARPAST